MTFKILQAKKLIRGAAIESICLKEGAVLKIETFSNKTDEQVVTIFSTPALDRVTYQLFHLQLKIRDNFEQS